MFDIFLACVLCGAVTGLLSGLLGLGGGIIIVPALVWLFSANHFPDQLIMIMAVATSLATIIVTATSSIMTHHRFGTILWDRVIRLSPGILLGAGIGAVVADLVNADLLRWFFIAYLFYVGFRMAIKSHPKMNIKYIQRMDYLAGNGIGFLSSILGIGGGTLTVPYLVGRKVPMKNAVAISSACGLPIAISGTISYIWLGWNKMLLPEWSFGYIYLPALFGIMISSVLTAPMGAILANKLPAQKIKRVFSAVIFFIAIKMIIW